MPLSTQRRNLERGLRRAVYGAIARARAESSRPWYRFTAPSLEDINPVDVKAMFLWLRARSSPSGQPWRPSYAWGVARAAIIAKALGFPRMSAIEFGVAGGNGLVALESAAEGVEAILGLGVDVFGFDTGSGMPPPVDHRDAPFAVHQGDWEMEVEKLRMRLRRAELLVGPVGETVPAFLRGEHGPIGFISNDLDYYSSTMQAFGVLDADSDRLLPRVLCDFAGTMWHPWTEFNGTRAAISDFNASHERRKISPIYGLRYDLPRSEFRDSWPEKMFVAEIFDHHLYDADQGIAAIDNRLAG